MESFDIGCCVERLFLTIGGVIVASVDAARWWVETKSFFHYIHGRDGRAPCSGRRRRGTHLLVETVDGGRVHKGSQGRAPSSEVGIAVATTGNSELENKTKHDAPEGLIAR